MIMRSNNNIKISRESPLILASSSPRRKMLLGQIGLPFRSLSSDIDENHNGGDPGKITGMLAGKKAEAAFREIGNHWILGADTVVVMGEDILGKPKDNQDAALMLKLLSGKEHLVITGFSILDPSGEEVHSEYVGTMVQMKELSAGEIEDYVATEEPFGKAGSYGIQGIGAFMIKSIKGSYTNVVGLPVSELISALLELGALERFPILLT